MTRTRLRATLGLTRHERAVVNWDIHWRRALELLRLRSQIHVAHHGSIRHRSSMASWYIEPLARLLGSRHIPDAVRERFPGIPWQLTARLASYLQRIRQRTWPVHPDFELIRDFNRRCAPRLAREIRKMRTAMAGSVIDGNRQDGILTKETSGRFLHVTLRLPGHRFDELRQFLAAAYENEIVPTTSYVREALKGVSNQLEGFGLTTLYVYGSVARGAASPASDIDIAYTLRGEIDLDRWVRISQLLELTLGKVIDAHRIEPHDLPPEPFVRVWARRRSRRRRTP